MDGPPPLLRHHGWSVPLSKHIGRTFVYVPMHMWSVNLSSVYGLAMYRT